MLTLRSISAHKCDSIIGSGIVCQLPGCNNIVDKPYVASNEIFCNSGYQCMECKKWFHPDAIIGIYPNNTCLCVSCSENLGYGSGPLKLDREYLSYEQYVFKSHTIYGREIYACGNLYKIERGCNKTKYSFRCYMKGLPSSYRFISWDQPISDLEIKITKPDDKRKLLRVVVSCAIGDIIYRVDADYRNPKETISLQNIAQIFTQIQVINSIDNIKKHSFTESYGVQVYESWAIIWSEYGMHYGECLKVDHHEPGKRSEKFLFKQV